MITLVKCPTCKGKKEIEIIHPMDLEDMDRDEFICEKCKKRIRFFYRNLKKILSKIDIDDEKKKLILREYENWLKELNWYSITK